MDNNDAIRVRLKLDHDSWHGTASEGIWTRLVKSLADKAIVEVNNIPFFSKALSFRDKIVIAFRNNEVVFDSIVERGGHSTYRVFLQNPDDDKRKILPTLNTLGCFWESTRFNGGELFALDIPPEVNIHDIYEILDRGQKEGLWLFEEGYIGHLLEGDPAPAIM